MKELSIAKLRSFQTCATTRGTFTFLALDHRQNLRRANPRFEDNHELSRFKLEVTAELAPFATGVLLDPEVSAAQAIASGALPGTKGLVVSLESTGYTGEPAARRSQILPDWSVEKAKRMGASMVKLLVYYHPDSSTAAEIETFVAQTAAECRRFDLALMLEPLSYPLEGERLSSEEKRRVVLETAHRLTAIPDVDLLKAELPQATDDPDMSKLAEACAELHEKSQIPWILLSAASSFETYLQQTEIACRAGASGIAVGRSVWQEAVSLDGSARLDFLRQIARPRLERLNALCLALARPFTEVYHASAPFDWYQRY